MRVELADDESLADLGTFASRARRLDDDGAVRLVVAGGVLAAYVCVVPTTALDGAGLVLGLRTYAVRSPAALDVTVPLAAVLDRTHRGRRDGVLPVPPVTVSARWAGVSPPRGGWGDPVDVPAARLAEVARGGVAKVAEGAPEGSGASAVAALRRRVWSEPAEVAAGVTMPSGLAFAVDALGFGGPARLFRSGPWWRLTGPGGHALAR